MRLLQHVKVIMELNVDTYTHSWGKGDVVYTGPMVVYVHYKGLLLSHTDIGPIPHHDH